MALRTHGRPRPYSRSLLANARTGRVEALLAQMAVVFGYTGEVLCAVFG
jgi:hypothetical protein